MGFSRRFKQLRKERKLTQEELANRLNINRTSIVHYENSNNERIPRPERLYQIADFFNVSVDYLLDRADGEDITEDEEEFISDTRELSIEKLQEKYQLTIDGEPASENELEGAIAFIRSLRGRK